MSREEIISKIRTLSERLEAAQRRLKSQPEDAILCIGVDAIREELSRLGRQLQPSYY